MSLDMPSAVFFRSADASAALLEGVLHAPALWAPDQRTPAALLCHPQPATSDMNDALLVHTASGLAEHGITALRFNFRGVGKSEGQQTDGRLEPLDVAGALTYLAAQPYVDTQKLCIIGHGFGGYIGLVYAAHDARIGTIVAVSPPVARLSPELGGFDRPKLFLTGEYDEVCPRFKLEPWVESLPNRALLVVSGAPHLMSGYEAVAAQTILQYVARWAATPGI
jgi:alpha/beta superfamily hydrolase